MAWAPLRIAGLQDGVAELVASLVLKRFAFLVLLCWPPFAGGVLWDFWARNHPKAKISREYTHIALPNFVLYTQRLVPRYRPRGITDVFLTICHEIPKISSIVGIFPVLPCLYCWVRGMHTSGIVGKHAPPVSSLLWRPPCQPSPCPDDLITSKALHGRSRSLSACRQRLCTHAPLKILSKATSIRPHVLPMRVPNTA